MPCHSSRTHKSQNSFFRDWSVKISSHDQWLLPFGIDISIKLDFVNGIRAFFFWRNISCAKKSLGSSFNSFDFCCALNLRNSRLRLAPTISTDSYQALVFVNLVSISEGRRSMSQVSGQFAVQLPIYTFPNFSRLLSISWVRTELAAEIGSTPKGYNNLPGSPKTAQNQTADLRHLFRNLKVFR